MKIGHVDEQVTVLVSEMREFRKASEVNDEKLHERVSKVSGEVMHLEREFRKGVGDIRERLVRVETKTNGGGK